MPFEVPASKASIKQNRFEFHIPGNRTVFSIPKLGFLKPALALRVSELSEIAAAKVLFDELLPEAFDLFEDTEQLEAFMAAWQKASGVGVGESQASTDS